LIIVGPNVPEGKVCNKPVQLLDIYPTLLELTNLEGDPMHEGHSLVPLLKDAEADWPYMARTSFGPGNYTIISEQYHLSNTTMDQKNFTTIRKMRRNGTM